MFFWKSRRWPLYCRSDRRQAKAKPAEAKETAEYDIVVGSHASDAREPGQTRKRAAISDCGAVRGKPGHPFF